MPCYVCQPEIIQGKGYGKGVDWWCLGVFIYELLVGQPPFRNVNDKGDMMKLYNRIKQCKYKVPEHVAPEGASMIQSLLKLKPHERLGCVADGEQKLRDHAWYKDFDWDAFKGREMRAPIIPFIEEDSATAEQPQGSGDHPHFSSRPYDSTGNWDEDF